MDVYNRMFHRTAAQKLLLLLGRVMTLVFVVIGCLLAPMLDNPKFGGVFQYIQQFQGYIWPGVVAAFLFGIIIKKAPGAAGVAALISGPVIYGLLQHFVKNIHFLIQVGLSFGLVIAIMALITVVKPLAEARKLPVREGVEVKTAVEVKIAGGCVIAAVAVFYLIFW